MKLQHILLLVTIITSLLLAACVTAQPAEPSPAAPSDSTQAAPVASATPTPPPTSTATSIPSPTETLTPTPHPIATMSALVSIASLNLRAGPSTIYAVLGAYPEDTELLAVARVPGNEWVRVQTADGKTGWMAAEWLDLDDEVAYLPLEEVTESIMVAGRVIDSDAMPVEGALVAVLQRLTGETLRTDAVSGEDGYFYAYIPKQSIGIWEAQIVGLNCTSRLMNENCNLKEHFYYSYRVIFEPPPISPILFLFQVATTYISGTLTDAEDKPVTLRVFAERSDGAYAFALADNEGGFSIPVGPGTWKVYAMQYNPNLEGEAVTVEIVAEEPPDPVSIKAPVP